MLKLVAALRGLGRPRTEPLPGPGGELVARAEQVERTFVRSSTDSFIQRRAESTPLGWSWDVTCGIASAAYQLGQDNPTLAVLYGGSMLAPRLAASIAGPLEVRLRGAAATRKVSADELSEVERLFDEGGPLEQALIAAQVEHWANLLDSRNDLLPDAEALVRRVGEKAAELPSPIRRRAQRMAEVIEAALGSPAGPSHSFAERFGKLSAADRALLGPALRAALFDGIHPRFAIPAYRVAEMFELLCPPQTAEERRTAVIVEATWDGKLARLEGHLAEGAAERLTRKLAALPDAERLEGARAAREALFAKTYFTPDADNPTAAALFDALYPDEDFPALVRHCAQGHELSAGARRYLTARIAAMPAEVQPQAQKLAARLRGASAPVLWGSP